MRIFAGVLPVSTILAFAVLTTTAARAQSEHDSVSCADVNPPALDPANTLEGVPIYIIPEDESGHSAICRATEALAEGMVDLELRGDRVLAHALGDPTPNSVTGEVSDFPYTEPGSQPTPGMPPPGPSPEHTDHSRAYAAFVDPASGVEYTFSTVAENLADAEQASVDWIKSTVEPLLATQEAKAPQTAVGPRTLATTATFAEPHAADAASYSTLAWNLLVDGTIVLPDPSLKRALVSELGKTFDTALGRSAAKVRIYRLNGNQLGADYFLVDSEYSQTPEYKPFDFVVAGIFKASVYAWANRETDFSLTATDPNHSTKEDQPALNEFAPQTKITSSTQTFTVGTELSSAPGIGVSGSYSITVTQESVDTSVKAGFGDNNLQWIDTYNGFGMPNLGAGGILPPPPSSINTFTGKRLAIFKVPRTVNDLSEQDRLAGKRAGLSFVANLDSHAQGVVSPLTFIDASWNLSGMLFAPEPLLSVSTKVVDVSLSGKNGKKQAIVNVTAEGVTPAVTHSPDIVNARLGTLDIKTGIRPLTISPKETAKVGDDVTVYVDTNPAGGADSVRAEAIQIKVNIVE